MTAAKQRWPLAAPAGLCHYMKELACHRRRSWTPCTGIYRRTRAWAATHGQQPLRTRPVVAQKWSGQL